MSSTLSPARPCADAALREYVVIIRDGLPVPLGERIVELFGTDDHLETSRIGQGHHRPETRSSEQVPIPRVAARIGTGPARSAARRLLNHVHDWIAEYEQLLDGTVSLAHVSGPGLVRYRTGDHFATHTDAPSSQHRVVSAIALLPSEFTGGELRFFDDDPVDLRPGDVCMFPSTFLYPHRVDPVTSGTRFSVVTWLS